MMKQVRPRVLLLALVAALIASGCARNADATDPEPPPPPPPPPPPATEPAPEPEPVDDRPRSELTGEPLDEDVFARPAVLVKIENSPQSRPQSGLEEADVVYEEVVEGGVTRFFTVFQSSLPELVGPVRSARPVDIQLIGTYGDALFAYSGARDEVRGMLNRAEVTRITEGFAGFFRDRQRRAPHNLYLDTTAALEAAAGRNIGPPPASTWQFDDDAPQGAQTCPRVEPGSTSDCTDPGEAMTIRMARNGYITNWVYDQAAGVYRRAQNGTNFTVTGEGRIGAANVVVLATRPYIGPTGYPETDATTEGAPAVILRDGKRYEATWRKPSATAPLELLDTSGEPFVLKPGPTWIHLPPETLLPNINQ